jgi:hypothetical protein
MAKDDESDGRDGSDERQWSRTMNCGSQTVHGDISAGRFSRQRQCAPQPGSRCHIDSEPQRRDDGDHGGAIAALRG